jgi:hypothetical protein
MSRGSSSQPITLPLKFSYPGHAKHLNPCFCHFLYTAAENKTQTQASGVRGTASPLQTCTGPYSSRRLQLPQFLDKKHIKPHALVFLPRGGVRLRRLTNIHKVINIYIKKTKGPNLMELFTATRKLFQFSCGCEQFH